MNVSGLEADSPASIKPSAPAAAQGPAMGYDRALLGEFTPPAGSATALSSSATLFKAVVGTGIFALPPAIREVGWLAGSVMVLLIAGLSAYTMSLVVSCVQELRRRGHKGVGAGGAIEFTDLTAFVFPGLNRPILFICLIANYGAILGFFDFAVANLLTLTPFLSRWQLILAIVAFELPLSLLRSTSHPVFKLAMTFGNLAVAAACASVVYSGAMSTEPRPLSTLPAYDSSGLGLAFGVCIFMFAAHMECVSIEQDMRTRRNFHTMLLWTFVVIVVLHLAFGIFIYSCFGEAVGREWKDGHWVDATILQNVGENSAVKLAMSANLLLMTPMTLLPVSKAIEDAFGVHQSYRPVAYSRCTRLGLIASLGLLAAVLSSFEGVCALVGCLTGLSCFTVPAACYLHIFSHRLGSLRRVWFVGLVLFGLVGTAFSAVQVVVGMVAAQSQPAQ